MTHKLRWLDQDLLNMLFHNKIKRIPNKWNVMISNIPDNLDEYYLPSNLRKEYFEARENPYIIHYVGRGMPCYMKEPDLYEYFWMYARKTIFYEILLQKMTMCYSENMKDYILNECKMKMFNFIPFFKKKIKRFLNVFFPRGTSRRETLKKIYSNIRA
jgi:lipopolysaccharide biosynthesis glycosyltransferase